MIYINSEAWQGQKIKPIQSQFNPIQTQLKPKQTQNKANNQSSLITNHLEGKPNFIYSEVGTVFSLDLGQQIVKLINNRQLAKKKVQKYPYQ